MSAAEIIVVVLGLLLGYWIVNRFLGRNGDLSGRSGRRAANDPADPFAKNVDPERSEAPRGSGRDSGHDRAGRPAPPRVEEWFEILGVSEHAAKQQIVEAYRKQIWQYHPDKVAHMGREIRELAEKKAKDINAAYEHAMKLRG